MVVSEYDCSTFKHKIVNQTDAQVYSVAPCPHTRFCSLYPLSPPPTLPTHTWVPPAQLYEEKPRCAFLLSFRLQA